jgi:hypothetical protein
MDRDDQRRADILDGCLSRLQAGGESVEDWLQTPPEDADWLPPLLLVVGQTRAAAGLQPMPDQRRAAGERRLRQQVRSRSAPAAGRRRVLRPAFALISVLLVLALLGSASGIAYAAEASLPGDSLYPVKHAIEQVQLTLSRTQDGDARLLVSMTEERLQEAEQLFARGRHGDLVDALEGYGQAVDDLLALAEQLPAEDGEGSLTSIQRHFGQQAEVLARLQASAPAQAGLMQAAERSSQGKHKVEKLLERRGQRHGPPADVVSSATPDPEPTSQRGGGKSEGKDEGKGEGRGRPTKVP